MKSAANVMSMPDILPASSEHAAACARLFTEGTPPTIRPLTILGAEGYGRYLARQVEASANGGDHHYWIARSDGDVVGAAEYRRFGRRWFLNNIHVDVRARGKGVGSRLLEHTISIGMARGCEIFALDVFASNEAARSWYERLGLNVVARTSYVGCAVPQAGEEGEVGELGNLPQCEVLYEAFGFAMLRIRGAGAYDVGVLGTTWYRISDRELLADKAAMMALRAYAPHRRFLLVSSQQSEVEDIVHLPSEGANVLAEALRMEAPIGIVAANC